MPIQGKWQSFLDSLQTKGGNLFILVILFLIGMGFVVYVMHHDSGIQQLVDISISTFAGIGGALLGKLSSGSAAGTSTPAGTNGNGSNPIAPPNPLV